MTAQQIVDLLNELLALDPVAINSLVKNRVPCNQALADHPTVTVDDGVWESGESWFTVGLLGILEGVAGIDGKLIASIDDDEKGIVGFKLIEFSDVNREPVQHPPAATSGVSGGYALKDVGLVNEFPLIFQALEGWKPKHLPDDAMVEVAVSPHARFLSGELTLRALARFGYPDRRPPMASFALIPPDYSSYSAGDLRDAILESLDTEDAFESIDLCRERIDDERRIRLPRRFPIS